MDSVFNSGVPHIGEKILKCLDIKSIVNCHSVNQGLRRYIESYTEFLDPMDFFKRIKSYILKGRLVTGNSWLENIIQHLWSPLIEIIDEKNLWNHDVKQQVYICMIRILHQENHFRSMPSSLFSTFNMDERPRMMILDSAIGKKHA